MRGHLLSNKDSVLASRQVGYHIYRLFLALILILFPSTLLLAQDLLLPNTIKYGRKEGLPQVQVTALMQDSRGYIWIGTKNGVARFNGEDFQSFSVKDGLAEEEVLRVEEDKENQVWVLCRRGISCISGDSISTTLVKDFFIQTMSIGQNDTIWFCGEGSRKSSHALGYFLHGEYTILGLDKDINISDIQYDATHNLLYVLSEEAIYTYDGALGEVHQCPFEEHQEGCDYYFSFLNNKMIYAEINRVEEDIKVYEIENRALKLIGHSVNREWVRPLPISIRDLFTLFFRHEDSFVVRGKFHDCNEFPGHFITSVLSDNSGVLWLGTERGLLRTFSDAIQQYSLSYLPEVWAVVQGDDGTIWTSSYANGIKTIKDGKVQQHQFNHDKKKYYYLHPVKDSKGALYFPHDVGITKVNLDHSTVELHSNAGARYVIYTYFDPHRKLILGGGHKNVSVWNEDHELVREIFELNDQPIIDNVLTIAQDSIGNYWFGGRSIYKYNWESKSSQEYLPAFDGNVCYEIATDAYGVVWFATRRGLFYYDQALDILRRIASPELQNLTSFVISIDQNNLMTSQPNGIYLLDLKAFHKRGKINLSYINEYNGYLSEAPEQAGAYIDEEGGVWVTSSTTLSRIQLDKIQPTNLHRANIIFREYNNNPIQFNQTEIKLPFNQNSVIIKLDAIAFSRPYPITYRYRTSPSAPWSDEISDDWIVLTDLPHGKTTLYVQPMYKGTDLPASNEIFMMNIKVNKALYDQKWFAPSLAIIFFVVLILSIIRLSKAKIRLENASTRAKISEIQTIQAQMNPHFVYNILANVQSKIRNQKTEVAEKQLLRLSQLIRGFLHFSMSTIISDESNLKSKKHLVDLESELKLLQEFIFFQQELYPNTFVYDLIIDHDIDISEVKIPSMILQPLVENAISHGLIPKGSIGTLRISIKNDNSSGNIIVIVSDDGIGMKNSEEMNQNSKLKYPSYGRKLTMRRIALLNSLGYHIKIDTESSEDGTTVTLSFEN